MPATIDDIALASGYSTATVSRALRGDSAVTPKTRKIILNICSKLGYKPSVGGRILAQGASAFVGLSLGQADHSTARYVSLLHQALSQQLTETGWGLRLISSGSFSDSLSDVGAVIIIGTIDDDPRVALCRAQDMPCVAIGHDRSNTGFSVVPDDDQGARLVVRHFANSGRRRLAVMPSWRDHVDETLSIRAAASVDEAQKLGLQPKILPAVNTITSTLDGYRTILAALDHMRKHDCLFCETDEQALGAQAALLDSGFSVPGDIAVAGFDDLPVLSAKLTTVRQDFSLLAATVLNAISQARRREPPVQLTLPVTLMLRESG